MLTTISSRTIGVSLILAGLLVPEVQAVEWGVGTWKSTELGNQRAVVEVGESAEAVWLNLPWRRRDPDPAKKAVWVCDAEGKRVENALAVGVTRESGDVIFQPTAGPDHQWAVVFPEDRLHRTG